MGRLAAIGGGDYEENDLLVGEIIRLSGKECPNALFIGTALQDSTNPLTSFKKSFKRMAKGAVVKKLSLIRNSYSNEEIDALLSWADVIFVGGGNTAFMLREWQKFGLGEKLARIFREDLAVLSGVSAGAICWFRKGYTDSAMFSSEDSSWEYEVIEPGLNLIDAFFCPHYNNAGRAGFDELALSDPLPGIGLGDRAAYIYDRGTEYYVSADPLSPVFCFENGEKKPVSPKMLQKC